MSRSEAGTFAVAPADFPVWLSRSLALNSKVRLLPRLFVATLGLLIATLLLTPLLICTQFFHPPSDRSRYRKSLGMACGQKHGTDFFLQRGGKSRGGNAWYIVTPNHQSNADILALICTLPVKFRWVVKRELLVIPLFGWALARTGAVPLNRKDRTQSISRLQQAAESKFKDGWSVLIYPEGTRSPDGNLQEFKKGAFMMAVQTGIPILPITCNGAFKVLPKDTIFVQGGHITLTIGDPIDTNGLDVEDIPQLMEKTRQAIGKHFDADYDPFNGQHPH